MNFNHGCFIQAIHALNYMYRRVCKYVWSLIIHSLVIVGGFLFYVFTWQANPSYDKCYYLLHITWRKKLRRQYLADHHQNQLWSAILADPLSFLYVSCFMSLCKHSHPAPKPMCWYEKYKNLKPQYINVQANANILGLVTTF